MSAVQEKKPAGSFTSVRAVIYAKRGTYKWTFPACPASVKIDYVDLDVGPWWTLVDILYRFESAKDSVETELKPPSAEHPYVHGFLHVSNDKKVLFYPVRK